MNINEYLSSQNILAKKLAEHLGVPPPLISQWRNGRPVPIERCVAIERVTNGAVTRRDLRPADWHLIWPELIEKDAA